jgi:hypothetical protein
MAISYGLIFAITVGLAVLAPNPITIGSAVVCGCMFLIALVNHAKR